MKGLGLLEVGMLSKILNIVDDEEEEGIGLDIAF